MTTKFNRVVVFFVSLFILTGVAAGLYWSVHFVLGLFGVMEPRGVASTIAGLVVLLIGSRMFFGKADKVQNREHRDKEHQRKAEMYRQLIAVLDKSKMGSSNNNISTLEQDLVLWASPSVMRCYTEFRNMDKGSQSSDQKRGEALETLIREMRKDLGVSNLGLENATLGKLLRDTQSSGGMKNKRTERPPV